MKILNQIKFRTSSFLNGSSISMTTSLTNCNTIVLGKNCIIKPYSVLMGGKNTYLIIGDNVLIKNNAYLNASYATIKIGSNSAISHYVWVGGEGQIYIGENVMIGMHTVIISSNHDYYDISTPFYNGAEIAEKIDIGKNVWIGANCTILPEVVIGDGAVVGAGSVVVKNIKPNTIVVGNPAVEIRKIHRSA